MDKEFRRQFIIKEGFGPKSFNKKNISDKLFLYFHPDLRFCQSDWEERTLILLGFIIDPYNSKNSNQEIIDRLVKDSKNFDSLLENSKSMSGRWVLVYKDSMGVKIFTDSSGLRQVHYSNDFSILGSDPALINKYLQKSPRDDEDFKAYISSKFYKINEMEWYGPSSFYKNIYKLLPNHYIDLEGKNVKRFWQKFDKLPYNESIKRVGDILINEFKAIDKRDIKKIQSLTGGFDSRIIFGASIRAGVNFPIFISTMNKLDRNSPDIKIAQKILSYYGKDLHIIDDLEDLRDNFLNIYKKSIDNAQLLDKTLTIQYFYDRKEDFVHISGNLSAVFKDYYEDEKIDEGKDISRLIGIPKDLKIFDKYFNAWLYETRDIVSNENIDIMKLFYWENRLPNWGVQYIQEQDIAMEEYPPFNNREIFLRLLYLNEKEGKIFKDLLAYLDPNLLDFPINPKKGFERFKEFIKSRLSKRSWERIKTIVKGWLNTHLFKYFFINILEKVFLLSII